MQAIGQNAQEFFTHLRDGAVLITTPSQPLVDDMDANGSDTNVFASDCEISMTDVDVLHALKTPPMQEIQYFIIRFMELLTGRNVFAIDFQANPIAQAQRLDYKARTLHVTEVARHAEVPPHHVLNKAANSRVGGYIQNFQFQILMLHKFTILSIQHLLVGSAKEIFIDLVGMCAALLRFAERSTYIRIQMKEGAQGAKQFDPGKYGVISHTIQPLHALRLIQGQGSQDIVNPQAGQYQATAIGPGQQIQQTTDTKTIDTTTIPRIWHAPRNAIILMFSVTRPLLIDPTFIRLYHMNLQQSNVHREIWAQRSYTLRYLCLKASEEHHRGFGEGLLNVRAFIQRHTRHQYLTVNDWKAYQREVQSDLYLDTVRIDLDEDDNLYNHNDHDHDHDRNYRHAKCEKTGMINQTLDEVEIEGVQFQMKVQEKDRIMMIESKVDIVKLIDNNQDNLEFKAMDENRIGGLIQESVQRAAILTAQEEAYRRINNISPNLDEESNVSWISSESVNQERSTPITNLRTAQQLLAAQDNQEQLIQQVNIQIQQQINQLHEVNREIQIQQQDVIINNTQNEQ
ncbi:MAG: hypothetical protein EZS28_012101 [Streblomastix strix]|uniref:Uncharacterized protein n=1 Tax=Streblomastix strix TaxID=222440 RepID=A0A5J4WBQ1_9EUKA|nr:MAG: hypothetical protein EZS28_012101 [Streblomastix strix]